MLTKIKISKKALERSILFGLICAIFCSFANFDASCEELRHNVLRLHIIANSDSKEDQVLKLKIRDTILEESSSLFEQDADLSSAIETAEKNLSKYEKIANEVIAKQGFNYRAEVKIGKAFFETRVYDDFTLPAGEYDSLIVEIGKAKGKNWWCVIFPQVCVPTMPDATLQDSVGKESAQIAENPNGYIIRFKTVELYEKLRWWLNGRKNA